MKNFKKFIAVCVTFGIIFCTSPPVLAGNISVSTESELRTAVLTAADGTTITVAADITVTDTVLIDGKNGLTINLNGKSIIGKDGENGIESEVYSERCGTDGIGCISVTNSNDIHILNGTIKGGSGGTPGKYYQRGGYTYSAAQPGKAGNAVSVSESSVIIENCRLFGGNGGSYEEIGIWDTPAQCADGSDGGNAIRAESATITLNGGSAISGNGGNGSSGGELTGAGGNSFGILLDEDSFLTVISADIRSGNAGNSGPKLISEDESLGGLYGTYANGGISAAIYGQGNVTMNSGTVYGGYSGYLGDTSASSTTHLNNEKWFAPPPCYGIVCSVFTMYGGDVYSSAGTNGRNASAQHYYIHKYYETAGADGGDSIAVKAANAAIFGGTIHSGSAGNGGNGYANVFSYGGYKYPKHGDAGNGGNSIAVEADSVTISDGTIKAGLSGNGGNSSVDISRQYASAAKAGSGGGAYSVMCKEECKQFGGTIYGGIAGNGGSGTYLVSDYSNVEYTATGNAGNGGNSYAIYSHSAQISDGIIYSGKPGQKGSAETAECNTGANGIAYLVKPTDNAVISGGKFKGLYESAYLLDGSVANFKIVGSCEFAAYPNCIVADFELRECADAERATLSQYVAPSGSVGEYFKFERKTDNVAPTLTYSVSPQSWTKGSVVVTLFAEDSLSGLHRKPYNFGRGWTDVPTLQLSSNASFIVQARDADGNITSQVINITNIDKTAPEVSTSVTLLEDNRATLTVAATDVQSGVMKIVNDTDELSYNSSSITVSISQAGTYTFTVYDNVGNSKKSSVTISRQMLGLAEAQTSAAILNKAELEKSIYGCNGYLNPQGTYINSGYLGIPIKVTVCCEKAGIYIKASAIYSGQTLPIIWEDGNDIVEAATDLQGEVIIPKSILISNGKNIPVTVYISEYTDAEALRQTADTVTLKTKVSVDAAPPLLNGYYTEKLKKFTITSADAVSGIKSLKYKISYDGGANFSPLQNYTAPFFIEKSGVIKCEAVDNVGNVAEQDFEVAIQSESSDINKIVDANIYVSESRHMIYYIIGGNLQNESSLTLSDFDLN